MIHSVCYIFKIQK